MSLCDGAADRFLSLQTPVFDFCALLKPAFSTSVVFDLLAESRERPHHMVRSQRLPSAMLSILFIVRTYPVLSTRHLDESPLNNGC